MTRVRIGTRVSVKKSLLKRFEEGLFDIQKTISVLVYKTGVFVSRRSFRRLNVPTRDIRNMSSRPTIIRRGPEKNTPVRWGPRVYQGLISSPFLFRCIDTSRVTLLRSTFFGFLIVLLLESRSGRS